MKNIVIYSGRFQPFGPHHFESYKRLCNMFGSDNVFIATSDKVEEKSPLNFQEKLKCILQYQVKPSNVIQVKNPYKSEEIISRFNMNEISVIFAYGKKDYGRISFVKKDGTPGFFKEYYGQKNLDPISKCGYAMEMPHVKVNYNGNELSGTLLRKILPLSSKDQFKEIMGYFDEEIYNLIKKKFNILQEINLKMENLIETKQIKKYSKHLMHPYDDQNLTFDDFYDLIFDLVMGRIDQSSIKYDGHNLQITVIDNEVRASRNKGTIINPMTLGELKDKFSDRPQLEKSFSWAMMDLMNKIASFNDQEFINSIFNNGRTFLNFEICHQDVKNVYDYGNPKLLLHSLKTYDELGNQVDESNNIPKEFEEFKPDEGHYEIQITPKVQIKKFDNNSIGLFLNEFTQIKNRGAYRDSDLISGSNPQTIKKLKFLIWNIGNQVISQIVNETKPDRKSVTDIINIINLSRILAKKDKQDKVRFQQSLADLLALGGFKAINPIEGIVFKWRRNSYKLTGSFGALVPIFSIYNKDRFQKR